MEISNVFMQAPKVSTEQNSAEKANTKYRVDGFNKELKSKGLKHTNKLGQDHFLKLLVTQLKHQDPLSPMKDKNFIAQMAQFSSLEQMTKVNKTIKELVVKAEESGNYNLIGKKVGWIDGVTGRRGEGIVDSLIYEQGRSYLVVGGAHVSSKEVVRVEPIR